MKAIYTCLNPNCETHGTSTGVFLLEQRPCPFCGSDMEFSYDADVEERTIILVRKASFAIGGVEEMQAILGEIENGPQQDA